MLPIEPFGAQLIITEDLDPVYVAIWAAKLPHDQVCRLLFAYWCFYHLGVAAWMSEHEGQDFWRWMRIAGENKQQTPKWGRWPRMAERRHFRGAKCVAALDTLSQVSKPEIWVESLLDGPLTDKAVMSRIQSWPMFGPWIAFKAADMLERCLGAPVRFSSDIGLVYAEPRSALDMLGGDPAIRYEELIKDFGAYRAPPAHNRFCGPQEVETVLCKWKSHMRGHYWVGKDIHENHIALSGWGQTASKMLAVCPKVPSIWGKQEVQNVHTHG